MSEVNPAGTIGRAAATGSAGHTEARHSLSSLRRIRLSRPATKLEESCDLCSSPIPEHHGHIVDLGARNLLCSCRPCWLLFDRPAAGGGHYRTVPDRYVSLDPPSVTTAQWEELQIPVGVAFFLKDSRRDGVSGFYPGPAGVTECLLPLGAWEDVVAAIPPLGTLEPDVEAVLVRQVDGERRCYIVPVDACFELAGHLRTTWQGFDGGCLAHEQVDAFFEKVSARATPERVGSR